ncbi:hypothetical protein GCM10023085_28040 [Actinomadura viridis]|uniref:Uncharacterized protein n=1 Tax=Actinomadura viridis TaxID=58110 RepID=A0A931GHS3_9ACTN|nr:hypothetical protein [Actinomadura viridis]MBG6087212.1 hypothetical protein [Actinomadura viridis]
MTAVVLVGELPSTGIIPEPVAWRVADSAAPEAALAFVDQMAHALRRHGAALVVYPAWRSEAAVRLVRMARALLNTDRIAGRPLDLPPLALSLVADQLAFMAPHIRPGVLAGIVQVLADRIYTGAWVNSVAKLEHVRTGLGQHMASLMPGSGFMVAAGTRPAVQRVTSAKPVLDVAHRPLDPVLMLASHEHGDVDWLQKRLKPELRVVSLTFVASQPLSAQYWGTKKYAEFVAFSGHPQDLHAALEAVRHAPCPWCGEPAALAVCPFCHRAQPGAQEQAPAGTAVQPGPGPQPPGPGPQPPGPGPGHQPPGPGPQPSGPVVPAQPQAASAAPPAPPAPAPPGSAPPSAVPQGPAPPRPGPQAPVPPPGPQAPVPPAGPTAAPPAPVPMPMPAPTPMPDPQPPQPPRSGAPKPPQSFGAPPPAAPTAPQPVLPARPDPGEGPGAPSERWPPSPGPAPDGKDRTADAGSPPDHPDTISVSTAHPDRTGTPVAEPEPPTVEEASQNDEASRNGTIEFRPIRNH